MAGSFVLMCVLVCACVCVQQFMWQTRVISAECDWVTATTAGRDNTVTSHRLVSYFECQTGVKTTHNQISVKICTCKKQIALITIKRPSRLRSQPVLPRCKANSTLSVLKWRLHWCLHKSLTVKLNFTLLIHPPLSCISFMSRQSTAISICQLKMCVNEECVGALMMKLSPPAILNLGLNLRSVLYLLIKVVPKLG